MTKTPSEARGGPVHEHLSDTRLAAVAGGDRALPHEEVHLATCRSCAAVYAELVRLRAEDLTSGLKVPHEILSTGRQVVRERSAQLSSSAPVPPRGSALSWLHRPGRIYWATAPALAVVALLLLAVLRPPSEMSSTVVALPDVVQLALVENSSHGLVHPWVVDADAFDAPVLRGAESPAASMDEALDALLTAQRESEGSVQATASLVAAYQAADQLANARAYLDLARAQYPEDEGIRELELMQAYQEGRLELAEQMLRERLEVEPDKVLARLNLAILLHEQGDSAAQQEASSLAVELVVELQGSALGLRAQRILD